MPGSQSFFMECFKEVSYQFPGSNPRTLGELATRLHKSMTPARVKTMSRGEVFRRCAELSTALETLPQQMRGLRPEDGRPANAKD